MILNINNDHNPRSNREIGREGDIVSAGKRQGAGVIIRC